jgi:hypothetical protein
MPPIPLINPPEWMDDFVIIFHAIPLNINKNLYSAVFEKNQAALPLNTHGFRVLSVSGGLIR